MEKAEESRIYSSFRDYFLEEKLYFDIVYELLSFYIYFFNKILYNNKIIIYFSIK